MLVYKNLNSNVTLSEKEYLPLVKREATDAWSNLHEEDKGGWDNDFNRFLQKSIEDDSDFISGYICSKCGQFIEYILVQTEGYFDDNEQYICEDCQED